MVSEQVPVPAVLDVTAMNDDISFWHILYSAV